MTISHQTTTVTRPDQIQTETECVLELREDPDFTKPHPTSALSAAASSPIGSYWNNDGPLTSNQPISTVCSQSLPHLASVWHSSQSGAAADVHVEEEPPVAENQQNHQNQDCMELYDDVDPETGERAQE
ncbi:hypothetical protein INR49_019669 [Caranx melampygus]|nr:hypothetical protein INR49_019669 [Caranx melampygus]